MLESLLAALVLAVALQVWFGMSASRVFARLGGRGRRAWVPLLGEAELLRLGDEEPWLAALLVVPGANVVAFVRKAAALGRINARFGRGPGATVLGILLPPAWATLLAATPGETDAGLGERIARSAGPGAGYAFAVGTPNRDPGTAPDSGDVPMLPPPLGRPPGSAPAPADPAPAAPAVRVVPPPLAPPPPAAAPAPERIVPPAGLIPAPGAPAAPTAPTPVTPAAPAAPAPASWSPLAPPPLAPPPAASPAADDDLDRTVVVDDRLRVPWRLVVEGGPSFRLTGTRAVLGRRPAGTGDGAQEIAVPDATRTLSKVHARLDLVDDVWIVTDLHATNGVIVVDAAGARELLEPGASAPVAERFVLGKVELRLVAGAEGEDR